MSPSPLHQRVPYRILTPRLEIRAFRPDDLLRSEEAICSSIAHLRQWFPWALEEPVSREKRTETIGGMIDRYQNGVEFPMGIFSSDGSRQLGGAGFVPRGRAECWEIGYWIRADEEGRGFVTETAQALSIVALGVVQLPRLEIRCETRNLRSKAIPERLGFHYEGTLRNAQRDVSGNLCDVEVRSLLLTEFAEWPHRDLPIQCFDREGQLIAFPVE
jgi:ribosomal-protein-serine acetyltransferase